MKNSPAALVVPPALAVSVLVWAVLAFATGAPPVAAVPAVAAGLLVGVLLHSRAPRSVLRTLGAGPLAAGEHPRLANLVEGVCTTHGFREPEVHVVESPAINAASLGLGRSPAWLVVTSGALASLGRLELEAVVARQLCAIRRGTAYATVLASVARIPGALPATARLAESVGGFDAASDIDIEAARLTSFPPAMASAIKVAAEGPGLDTSPAAAHLWMVEPHQGSATAEARSSALQRVDALSEI